MMIGVGCVIGVCWTMTGTCATGVGCVAAEVRTLMLVSDASSPRFIRKRKMMAVAAMAVSATAATMPPEKPDLSG